MGKASKQKWEARVLLKKESEHKKTKRSGVITMVVFIIFGLGLAAGTYGLYKYLLYKSGWRPTPKKFTATVETSMGTFKIEMETAVAPNNILRFTELARDGYYENLIFHRVVKDFIIQGGDPKGDGTGGPDKLLDDEINPKAQGLKDDEIKKLEEKGYKFNYKLKTPKMEHGVVAFANHGPNTNGSQFFVLVKDISQLNGKYTPLGRIADEESMKIVMAINAVEVDGEKPKKAVKILKIVIEETG